MQLNAIIFAAPKCSYSTSSLLKDLIYVPRCPSRWVKLPSSETTRSESINTSDSPASQPTSQLISNRETANQNSLTQPSSQFTIN